MLELHAHNLAALFRAVTEKYPENPAIVWDQEVTTYRELAGRVYSLAGMFLQRGCRPGDVIAIAAEKDLSTYACLLACLQLGTPYVLLDPSAPLQRQEKILERCRPSFLVVAPYHSPALADSLSGYETESIFTDSAAFIKAAKGDCPPAMTLPDFSGEQPAYIMFTSGSTGFPKGAVMTHLNVLLLISWCRKEFSFGPGEVLTNVNPLYFDNSVFDIFSSFFTGAALAPFSPDTVRAPHKLLHSLDHRGCTSWFSVPSLLIYLERMKALKTDSMRHIRRFIFGGEGYPKRHLQKLYETYSHRVELINVYGPTECTCISSIHRIGEEDFRSLQGLPPLGRLTEYFDCIIVDEDGHETFPGQYGELYLLGPCVGKGYYNDPERTGRSFIQDPRTFSYQQKTYRTGDIVKIGRQNGLLYISGRRDNQIKHMGYRIELEEIEQALLSLEGINQAGAVHGDREGISCLAAMVSASDDHDEQWLLTKLRNLLPEYMIPSEIIIDRQIPHNTNGKIDRSAIYRRIFC